MTLDAQRRYFAEELEAVSNLQSHELVEAFARVPREAFLGPGPWKIGRHVDNAFDYTETPDADPRRIYHNVLVAIDPARRLNNGEPGSLARWIEGATIQRGDAVLHVGCGLGYYTAIMAELVGPDGRVLAYEVDAGLAGRARAHLAPWPQVQVEAGDASLVPGRFDAIFVNAGCTYARREWIDALSPAGRLVLPLTVHVPGYAVGKLGVMLRLERTAAELAVRILSQVAIYDCANARDPAHEPILHALAASGKVAQLRAVAVEPHEPGERCLAHIEGFCLQS